jgi:hypothetical protein
MAHGLVGQQASLTTKLSALRKSQMGVEAYFFTSALGKTDMGRMVCIASNTQQSCSTNSEKVKRQFELDLNWNGVGFHEWIGVAEAMKIVQFKVGDEVEWTSSSSGSTKTKIGKVEIVVESGKYPTPGQMKEADAYGLSRNHESYMVRVPGKTSAAKGKLYWPRASALKRSAQSRKVGA